MMSDNKKIAIIGDTHFGIRNASDTMATYQQDFIDNKLFPYLLENDIKVVIQLGDLVDVRKTINGKTLNFVINNWFKKFEDHGITLYQQIGNHDTFYKNTNKVNWLNSIIDNSNFKNIKLCDIHQTHNIHGVNIDIIPWINEENEEKIFNYIDNSNSKYLFGHLELSGFELTKGHFSQHGHSTRPFRRYDRVMSGHFHIGSKQGNVQYMGIPYQLDWNDAVDKKGFWVLDVGTDELEFVENTNRLFHRFYYNEDDIDLKTFDFNYYEDTYLKIHVKNKTDEEKYNDFINRCHGLRLYDFSILDTNQSEINDIDIDDIEVKDTLSILTKFIVNNVSDDLETENIVNHVRELYNEGLLLLKDT